MTISPGALSASLADRYAIERELGQGGMATVYLAHDRRHDRRVAVKVLRPELAAVIGAERFLSEIRTTANLQHPHILPLFDSGEASSFLFYVMPYVEGESLRDRLTREKQLPISDAVRIASEVASALDYAHRHGVIHRDIKPENILLHDGRALVADFGIALAASKAGSRMTETGMSLGTPHYMSPEQAMGEREITARSDVYALGAMLYEMLSGDPPFTGSTAQAIVAKVLTNEPPPLLPQRRSIPEHVETAVMTALEKLPADRFATAGEFGAALGGAGGTMAGATSRRTVTGRRAGNGKLALAAVGAAALALGALGGMQVRREKPADRLPTRFEISAPGLGFSPWRNVSLSADGRTLVYFVAGRGEAGGLYVRPLDRLEPRQIPGLGGVDAADNPYISPDGRELMVSRPGQTLRIPITGGQGTPLPGVPEDPFGVIDDAGAIVYGGLDGGIWRLPRAGGAVQLSAPDTANNERRQILTDVLPGGRVALVGGSSGTGFAGRMYALDLESGTRRPLLDVDMRGAYYAGRNTLVYVTADQMLYGVRFDPEKQIVTGDPVQLGGPVETIPLGMPRVTVSRTGTVVYAPRSPAELVVVDRQGVARPLLEATAEYHNPRFSPDGRSVSVDINEPSGRDVWVLSLDQGTLTRATFENDGHDAIWSRDGRSLVYVGTRDGRILLLRSRMDGSPGEPLTPDVAAAPGAWLADGRLLAVTTANAQQRGYNIMVDSAGRLVPYLATNFGEAWVATSPDGRWISYASDASRRFEVYVAPADGSGGRIQISVGGALESNWGADGRTLYYTATDTRQMMVAKLELTPTPRVVSREALFGLGDLVGAEPHANYDVAADGRIVMVRRPQTPRLVLIQNADLLVAAGAE
jgi:Tol biopolymer transport system component/tRNA A-37 threonylcarbamoyl transferase component Bud32